MSAALLPKNSRTVSVLGPYLEMAYYNAWRFEET